MIGNPPYVFAREKVPESEKNYYSKHYQSAKYQINTFILFMERAVELTKKGGYVGLIVPNSWLMVYSGEALRKYFLENVTVKKIVNLLGKTFSDAEVETVITILKNQKADENSKIEILENKNDATEFTHLNEKNQNDFAKDKEFKFSVFSDEKSDSIIKKMKQNSLDLDEIACVKAGLQAYEKGKGIPKQTAEDVKNRPYDYDYKFNDETYKYLDGSNVLRYGINWTGQWLWYGKHLAAPRTFNLFSGEKIIIREITSNFPHCINAVYTEETYLYNRSNIAVVKREGFDVPLKYILAILNSTLMSYYFKKNTAKAERKLFPKIILNDLRTFPIPYKNNSQFSIVNYQLSSLADKMLSFHSQRQTQIARFLHRINETYGAVKSALLEDFYSYTFAEIDKEFARQKIRLSLKQKDELEDYFNSYKNELSSINNQISETDRQIDAEVYKLYGLTEEEIATVEKA